MPNRQPHGKPSRPRAVLVSASNRTVCLLGALTVAVILFYASFYPRPLALPVASGLLAMCALAFAVVAALRWHNMVAAHFTFWDVAVVLLFLALGAGMLSDPQAVEDYLRAASESGAAQAPVAGPNTTEGRIQ